MAVDSLASRKQSGSEREGCNFDVQEFKSCEFKSVGVESSNDRNCEGRATAGPLIPSRDDLVGLRVSEEASTGLAAEPAGVNHADEQWTWAVLGFAETFFKHAHEVEADIEPDVVGEGEWTHGMAEPFAEGGVDGFGRSDLLHDGEDGLVDKGHENTIGEEAGCVVDLDRRFAKGEGANADAVEGALRGFEAADDLSKLDDRNGIEEVHADDLVGTAGGGCQARDGDRAGVRGKDGVGGQTPVQRLEDVALELEALGKGLNGERDIRQGLECEVGVDAVCRVCGFVLSEKGSGDLAAQVGTDGLEGAFEYGLGEVRPGGRGGRRARRRGRCRCP